MMENDNLESAINQIAFEIVNKEILKENQINKLLGVLSNDGVYAMWVYARSEKNIDEKEVMKEFEPIFKLANPDLNEKNLDYEEFFKALAKDLWSLLFIKDLLEKTLIYARYHAKAMEE